MPITAFDHVNVLTANLAEMIDWYDRILEMRPGPRPNFSDNGAWLYLNGLAIVHLVEVANDPGNHRPKIEHFALRAKGLAEFQSRLQDNDISWREIKVPGCDVVQLNIFDPDGNHIHIDFDTAVEG